MTQPDDKRSRSIDALKAMAEGADTELPEQAEVLESAEEEEIPSGIAALAADAPAESYDPEAVASMQAPAGAEALAMRRARAASLIGQSRRVHAHQFKKTMVPLLLVVGGLLFVMSILAMVLLISRGSASGQASSPLVQYGPVLVLLAWPLGGILILGAWLFHREISEAEKRDRRAMQNAQNMQGRG